MVTGLVWRRAEHEETVGASTVLHALGAPLESVFLLLWRLERVSDAAAGHFCFWCWRFQYVMHVKMVV
jgi:hypothetical protein